MELSLHVQMQPDNKQCTGSCNDTNTNECAICRQSTKFSCSSCGSTGYCSAECKDTDWPSHKVLCHRFRTHLAEEPIGHDAKLVVCFKPSASRPFLAWMTAEQIAQCSIDLRLESGSDALVRTMVAGINPIRQRPYRRPLLLMHDPHHFQHGINNHSVQLISEPLTESKWRGWVIATVPDTSRDQIDMRDLRELADFFTSYKLDDTLLGLLREGIKKNRGVRINCLDDVRCHSLRQYVSVPVPKMHPIYLEPVSCDISQLIGLPIQTYKYVHRTDLYSGVNQLAAHLHRCGDFESSTWGFPPQQWLFNTRSVLVVRCDGKDLLPEHAEALCNFCCHDFGDVFSLKAEVQAYRSGSQEERRKAFRDKASREGFERFFEQYRSSQAERMEWRHIPTPYEM